MKKTYSITINNKTYRVALSENEGIYEVEIDGNKFLASIGYDENKKPSLAAARQSGDFNITPVAQSPKQDSQNKILSPLSATVLNVKCKPGDALKKGDVILTIEAMKMETEIYAPRDIKITQVFTSDGQTVSSGEVLAEYE